MNEASRSCCTESRKAENQSHYKTEKWQRLWDKLFALQRIQGIQKMPESVAVHRSRRSIMFWSQKGLELILHRLSNY